MSFKLPGGLFSPCVDVTEHPAAEQVKQSKKLQPVALRKKISAWFYPSHCGRVATKQKFWKLFSR